MLKPGDLFRIKKNSTSDKSVSHIVRYGPDKIYKFMKYCNCGERFHHPDNKEVYAEGIGFVSFNQEIELLSPRILPRTEVEWLDRVQINFKD